MNKQESAIDRLDTVERHIEGLREEAKALRAIIEADPKKKPRGLCWVWDGPDAVQSRKVAIVLSGEDGNYITTSCPWNYAIPLTDSELQEYRGRWE